MLYWIVSGPGISQLFWVKQIVGTKKNKKKKRLIFIFLLFVSKIEHNFYEWHLDQQNGGRSGNNVSGNFHFESSHVTNAVTNIKYLYSKINMYEHLCVLTTHSFYILEVEADGYSFVHICISICVIQENQRKLSQMAYLQ